MSVRPYRPVATPARCSCRLVRLTMLAGVVIEMPACRVLHLWAPTVDQVEAGAECVAQLVDGSRIACAETPAALLKAGVGIDCVDAGVRRVVHERLSDNDRGVAQRQSEGLIDPEVVGSNPTSAIDSPRTELGERRLGPLSTINRRCHATARINAPPE